MLRGLRAIVVVLGMSCSADEQARCGSCADAIGRYYAAGCTYWAGAGGESVPVPHDVMVGVCDRVSVMRSGCADEMDAWLSCNARAGVPGCACGGELAALMWCR